MSRVRGLKYHLQSASTNMHAQPATHMKFTGLVLDRVLANETSAMRMIYRAASYSSYDLADSFHG